MLTLKIKTDNAAFEGDLDAWARVRRLSRWQALAVILGVPTADRILTLLAVRKLESEGI